MAEKIDVTAIFNLSIELAEQIKQQDKLNNVSKELLNSLETTFKGITKFTRFYLINAYDKFCGHVLMDLEFTVDFRQGGLYDLKLKRHPYALTINPLFLTRKDTVKTFIGGIANYIMKIAWMHPVDYKKLNPTKDGAAHMMLNLASDASSSSLVRRDIKLDAMENKPGLRISDDIFTTIELNNILKINSQESQQLKYYFDLIKRSGKFPGSFPDFSFGGSGNSGSDSEIATPENGKGSKINDWEDLDEEDTKDGLTTVVLNAYNSIPERERGTMPSALQSQIKLLMTPPEISWETEFKHMIGSQQCGWQSTRHRLNRRQPERSDLPGRIEDKIVRVVACFDTSGSMSDDDLKNCCNEVLNILRSQSRKGALGYRLTVVECDSTVQRVYDVKNMSEFTTKVEKGMAGRGGTSFTPAIQYINGEGNYEKNSNFPDAGTYRDAFMIYFTDGYGESQIPKPKTRRNMWVVLGSESNLSVREPYGNVKKLTIKRY